MSESFALPEPSVETVTTYVYRFPNGTGPVAPMAFPGKYRTIRVERVTVTVTKGDGLPDVAVEGRALTAQGLVPGQGSRLFTADSETEEFFLAAWEMQNDRYAP